MSHIICTQLGYLLRLLCAVACGFFIGLERETHLKTAGMRTHTIVALASALMMILSKYGFNDVLGSHINLDPSRVAAGVVSAIGFLGAGIIFSNKVHVSGVTTSAGIWATVGVGMAFGGGMYFLGLVSTLLVLVINLGMHFTNIPARIQSVETLTLLMDEDASLNEILSPELLGFSLDIVNVKAQRTKNRQFEMTLYVRFPKDYTIYDIVDLLKKNRHINSIVL